MPFSTDQEITEADIQRIIDQKLEESVNLEFKRGSMGNSEGQKKEIAKDVSAMANSAGGVIIYGIAEEGAVAHEISPVNGNDYPKEWLENIISARIKRKIQNLKIVPVRITGNTFQTVYVVFVPESANAPHMADGKYYRRHNFQVLEMDEYEVRQAYSRQSKTSLVLSDLRIENGGPEFRQRPSERMNEIIGFEYTVEISVENIGNTVERFYKVNLAMPRNILAGTSQLRQYHVRDDEFYSIFSLPSSSPLFQQEVNVLARFNISIMKHTLPTLTQHPLLVKLFYTNGSDEKTVYLDGILLYEGNRLERYFKD